MRPEKPAYDHKGNKYESVLEMTKAYNVDYQTFYDRKGKGWTLKECLMGKEKEKFPDGFGNYFDSVVEMCEYHSILPGTYRSRIERGWTTKEALSTPKNNKDPDAATDHKGVKYKTKKEMCDHYGIPVPIYERRIRENKTKEEALTTPYKKYRTKEKDTVTDHQGKAWCSVEEMCEAYGVAVGTYYNRKAAGYTLKECLTSGKLSAPNSKPSSDGEKDYISENEMIRNHNLKGSTYRSRKKRGHSTKQALKKPLQIHRSGPWEDHEGNIFNSKKEMCEYHGISVCTFDYRQRQGCSIKDSLSQDGLYSGRKKWSDTDTHELKTDHKGHEFLTVEEMCQYYGINNHTYIGRINKGWSKEKALTTPVKKSRRKSAVYKDHKDIEYSTLDDMLNTYGIGKHQYYNGLSRGWSLERILTEKRKRKRNPITT